MRPGVICGLSLMLVLSLLLEVFAPGTLVSHSLHKPTFLKFNTIWNPRTGLNEFLGPQLGISEHLSDIFVFLVICQVKPTWRWEPPTECNKSIAACIPVNRLLSCKTGPTGVEPVTSVVTYDPIRHCSALGQRLLCQRTGQSSQHPETQQRCINMIVAGWKSNNGIRVYFRNVCRRYASQTSLFLSPLY